MKRNIVKKIIIVCQLAAICVALPACGEQQPTDSTELYQDSLEQLESISNGESASTTSSSILEITDVEMDSIFAGEETDSNSIVVALPSANIGEVQNQWYEKIVAEINRYTGMNVTWKWYDSQTYDEQIEKDIQAGEVADVIFIWRDNDRYAEYVESGLFWEVGPYLDEYDNHAMTYELSRISSAYNGKLYGLPRQLEPLRDGLGYRVDWLNKLGLEPPTDWESFEKMLHAFTYDDPDGNGMDDTVGLVLDSRDHVWDVMEIWCGVPKEWGYDENGDLIHKTRTQEYRDAYAAFRKLYAQGVINNGTNGIADFRNHSYWGTDLDSIARVGSSIDLLLSFTNVHDRLEDLGVVGDGQVVYDLCPCVDFGVGEYCSSSTGAVGMLAITTNRIKTEEQLKQVLQFLNDVNDAPCDVLLRYGWEGITYGVDENDKNMRLSYWSFSPEYILSGAATYEKGFREILTGFVAEENKSLLYSELSVIDPLLAQMGQLEREYRDKCVINYGAQYVSETENAKGDELGAMLNAAEVQYITGEIDDAGFEAALNAWWENGGAAITAEKNEKYHAAGY